MLGILIKHVDGCRATLKKTGRRQFQVILKRAQKFTMTQHSRMRLSSTQIIARAKRCPSTLRGRASRRSRSVPKAPLMASERPLNGCGTKCQYCNLTSDWHGY